MSKSRNVDPIGVFDSGFGGLYLTDLLQKSLPNESFVFLADSANLPYGEKTEEEVRRYTLAAADELIQIGVKMLIIACHTASIQTIELLRQRLRIPVIGINEVLLKQLEPLTMSKALLLGTHQTVQSAYFAQKLPGKDISSIACGNFVRTVEDGLKDNKLISLLIQNHLSQTAPSHLIFACTHFSYLTPHFVSLYPDATIVDPHATLVETVQNELTAHSLTHKSDDSRFTHFYTTGDPQHFAEVGSTLIHTQLSPENVFELIREELSV